MNLVFNLLIQITLAAGGNEVGNGGVGFYCEKDKSYTLLDFQESPYKLTAKSDDSYEQIISQRLTMLSRVDAKNAKTYENRWLDVKSKLQFLDDIELTKTKDSFPVGKPEGCKLTQFALQRKSADQSTTSFYFNKNIWDKLDSQTKAGLIIHELVYEHYTFLGERTSIKVRKMVALIFSESFNQITQIEYNKRVQELKLPLY